MSKQSKFLLVLGLVSSHAFAEAPFAINGYQLDVTAEQMVTTISKIGACRNYSSDSGLLYKCEIASCAKRITDLGPCIKYVPDSEVTIGGQQIVSIEFSSLKKGDLLSQLSFNLNDPLFSNVDDASVNTVYQALRAKYGQYGKFNTEKGIYAWSMGAYQLALLAHYGSIRVSTDRTAQRADKNDV